MIVQVKNNQLTLAGDCNATTLILEPDDVYEEPFTQARNRRESRRVEVFSNPILSEPQKWELVKAIIKVERTRRVFNTRTKCWKVTDENSFYISTTAEFTAKQFCETIRNHWGIENRNHYVRDVSMGEDKSRIRINPNIFAKLRSFSLNILRANGVKNIALTLYENCMRLENVLNYKGIKEN